jgi:predicted aspartyl protease
MRVSITLLILFLTTALTGCSVQVPTNPAPPANAAAGEVSFELAGPGGAALLVPIKINGQGPFNFVLDTGATFTCIDQKLAEELKLPEQRGQFGVGVTIEGEGNVKLVEVNSMEVGTATASGLSACVIDLQNMRALGVDVRGLVGLNFLKSFRVVIDFQRKILQLQKPQD